MPFANSSFPQERAHANPDEWVSSSSHDLISSADSGTEMHKMGFDESTVVTLRHGYRNLFNLNHRTNY